MYRFLKIHVFARARIKWLSIKVYEKSCSVERTGFLLRGTTAVFSVAQTHRLSVKNEKWTWIEWLIWWCSSELMVLIATECKLRGTLNSNPSSQAHSRLKKILTPLEQNPDCVPGLYEIQVSGDKTLLCQADAYECDSSSTQQQIHEKTAGLSWH